jgi:hypothetical protein
MERIFAERPPHTQVSAAMSQPYYLDITHPKANKGEVVSYLSAIERFVLGGAKV